MTADGFRVFGSGTSYGAGVRSIRLSLRSALSSATPRVSPVASIPTSSLVPSLRISTTHARQPA